MGDSLLVVPIGIAMGGVAHRNVYRAVGTECQRQRTIDAAMIEIWRGYQLRVVESFRDRFALVRHPVAVGIAKTDDFVRQQGVRLTVLYCEAERVVGARFRYK